MGQVRHGSVRTTAVLRRAMQDSQESLRTPAQRYGSDPRTAPKRQEASNSGRPSLWPRLSACRYNPTVKAFHERLVDNGRRKIVVRTAVVAHVHESRSSRVGMNL